MTNYKEFLIIMTVHLYDYFNGRRNVFAEWACRLGQKERGRLNLKLDMLALHGSNLPTGLLSNTRSRHIKKLRIFGPIALRPMLCKGPINNDSEFTLLLGAEERNRALVPRRADHLAEEHRQEVLRDPVNRRRRHERIS